MLFPTVSWPTTSALVANLVYLYTLPLCIFFSSLYHNIVIQSTLLQYCVSRDTPVTPYTRLPISTATFTTPDLQRLQYPQYSQYLRYPRFLPQAPVDLATKFLIYTPFLYFLTFFPYIMSWLYHTVYIYSLIISTLLYIIATYTHFITLYYVKNLYSALPCPI